MLTLFIIRQIIISFEPKKLLSWEQENKLILRRMIALGKYLHEGVTHKKASVPQFVRNKGKGKQRRVPSSFECPAQKALALGGTPTRQLGFGSDTWNPRWLWGHAATCSHGSSISGCSGCRKQGSVKMFELTHALFFEGPRKVLKEESCGHSRHADGIKKYYFF